MAVLNFATPGVDLLTIGASGLSVNPGTTITFGTDPTAFGDYELIAGDIGTPDLGNFILPTAPVGERYSLAVVSGNIDLVVAAVPEPGTLALLGAGLMSLLTLAWRRRKAGK